jgi:phage terminase large subunit
VLRFGMAERYRQDPVAWINHWAFTYDPRIAGTDIPTTLPFVLFRRQVEFADFLLACVNEQQNGLVEKSRDMGATWLCCAFSVWLWLYWPGAAVGWGSRKEQLVDKIGDPDSIFEKMRIIIRHLPKFMLPARFSEADDMPFMKIINRVTGATITGEAGDNIGRGGRKLIYFKDESAHYERPEKIEAALADNTNCQIDISSVNGLGNVFHRRREAGQEYHPGQALARNRVNVFVMDWRDHPAKDQAGTTSARPRPKATACSTSSRRRSTAIIRLRSKA